MNALKSKKILLVLIPLLLLGLTGLLFVSLDEDNAPSSRDSTGTATSSKAKSGLAAYDENGDGIVYQGGMHPDIVQDEPGNCPICGMKLNPKRVDGTSGGGVKVSSVTLQNMGVRTAEVEVASLGRNIQTTGRFEASEQGMTSVSPKIGGWVEKLHVDYEGQRVQKGQPLLEIYSPELVSTQEEYLLALRNAERLENAGSARRLVEAARRRLQYWDISSQQIERLKATGTPTKTLTLYAPASGTVKRKSVTEGQQIRAGQTLMHLSDLNPLWLMLDVYEQDLSAVKVGSAVVIDLPYAPGQKTRGQVDYIYDEIDEQSRTARARVTVPNADLRLKPGMYADATIKGKESGPHPVVPAEAVVSGGGRDVVIKVLGEGRFQPVPVRTGIASDGRVQILGGLEGGEQVVTSAQFLIDSEARLQSALGAMDGGIGQNSSGHSDHSQTDRGTLENSDAADNAAGSSMTPEDVRAADANSDGFVFQGPMHPDQIQDEAGNCPVCNMNLKRVPVEEAVQNLQRTR